MDWSPERLAALSKGLVLIIIGGIVFGIFAVYANLYYVAAIVGGVSVALLVAWKFEATLLVYILVAFVCWGRTPDLATGGSGAGKGVFVSEILLSFLLMIYVIRRLLAPSARHKVACGFTVPIVVYLAFSIWNVAHSYVFWDENVSREYQHFAVNLIELALRFLSAGAFLIAAAVPSDRRWLRWMTAAVLVPGIYDLGRATGVIPLHLPVFGGALLQLPLYCYTFAVCLDSSARLWQRIVCGFTLALGIFVVLIKGITWVSGWYALFVSMLAVTFLVSKKVFLTLIAILVVALVVLMPVFQDSVVKYSAEEGDYDRFALMSGAIKYAAKFPLGVGIGNYRSYNSFHYGEEWGTTRYTFAHGTYSQHLAEMGFPGTILFLWILISGFRWLSKMYHEMKPGESKRFVLCAAGQLAGISLAASIGDYIIPAYHNGGLQSFSWTVYSWLIWGLAVAHVRVSGVTMDISKSMPEGRNL